MLSRRNEILNSGTFAPRAHLDGLTLPPGFQLPPLEAVVSDVDTLSKLQAEGGPGNINVCLMSSRTNSMLDDSEMTEPLRYNAILTRLFKFSYFTHVEDVPKPLLEPVIFALQMFVRVLEESSEDALRAIGHILPHQKGATADSAKYLMLANSRFKLSYHLMSSTINRPQDALPYIKASIATDEKRLSDLGKTRKKTWQHNPLLWATYAEALFLTDDYSEAKTASERTLEGLKSNNVPNSTATIVVMHLILSYILKELDLEPVAQQDHTQWAVRYLKKNPKALPDEMRERYLILKEGQSHPVLEALGGDEWLDKMQLRKKTTFKEDERKTRRCRECGTPEASKPLFRCGRCQHIYYCSKECQRANWKSHKVMCKEFADSLAKLETLKVSDSDAAQKHQDWITWRSAPSVDVAYAHAHALGLHRDPSRCKTHIILEQVEYTPAQRDVRNKFRVKNVGVFRIADAASAIEGVMGLNPGEGTGFVREAWDEMAAGAKGVPGFLPMLWLAFGDNVETWLGTDGITEDQLRLKPYNPEWAKVLGRKTSPNIVGQWGDAKNVMDIFD